MQEILVMTSAYTCPYRLSGWRWGGRTASGDGSVQAIFPGGNLHGSVAFSNPRFSPRKSYLVTSNVIKSRKEQEKRGHEI